MNNDVDQNNINILFLKLNKLTQYIYFYLTKKINHEKYNHNYYQLIH